MGCMDAWQLNAVAGRYMGSMGAWTAWMHGSLITMFLLSPWLPHVLTRSQCLYLSLQVCFKGRDL